MNAVRGLVLLLASCAVAASAAGCGRHVVVDPDTAARANDRGWKITSEPGRSAAAASAPVPAPTPTAPPSGA